MKPALDKRINIEAERAAFEAWAKEHFGCSEFSFARAYEQGYFNAVHSNTFGGRKQAEWAPVSMLWDVWQEATRRATPSATGVMEDLPELPEPGINTASHIHTRIVGYTAEQYQQGQHEAIAHYQRKQAGQVGVKTWQERAQDLLGDRWRGYKPDNFMEAEIADLRAQLAAPSFAPTAGGERQSIESDEFINLINIYFDLCTARSQKFDVAVAHIAWKNLIAHIDTWAGRSAGERERELCAKMGAMQAQIDQLTAERSAGDAVPAPELPPIDYDKAMDRTYIPLPGGWEIQTKGKGSTFRIAHIGSRTRWMVLDDNLHEPLEALARDMRNAICAPAHAPGNTERSNE